MEAQKLGGGQLVCLGIILVVLDFGQFRLKSAKTDILLNTCLLPSVTSVGVPPESLPVKPVFEEEFEPRSSVENPSEPAASGREERRPVELGGYLIRGNKKIVDVKVVDLSYDGCAIHTLVPLVPGEELKLSVLGRGAVTAVVRWYHSRKAGLLFKPQRASRTHWPRRAERVEVHAEISLRRSARLSYRVKIVDLTRFGCKCEFVERPTVYEHVWVKLDGLETIGAVVCWIEESSIGLMFKKPLHPAVFDMVLDRLKPIEEPAL